MSWARVRDWRDDLRAVDVGDAGVRWGLDVALDALSDQALDEVAAMPGRPFPRAAMAVARTVPTAPVEWCAVLLGRGSHVVLKHPAGHPGLAPVLVDAARRVGLPLSATDDRNALAVADLIVAMGSDHTAAAIRAAAPPATRVLAFGHRFSVAWLASATGCRDLASDIALHDSRGCMSPVAVFSPLPLDQACDAVAEGLDAVEIRRGAISGAEAAAIRTRRALSKVVGMVREGADWSVHGLPLERFRPGALPRSVAVHCVTDEAEWRRVLAPWTSWLSTIGTDIDGLVWPGVRVCIAGAMQRPPLVRPHDGVDWLRLTLQPPT